jgi:hypothetical protein
MLFATAQVQNQHDMVINLLAPNPSDTHRFHQAPVCVTGLAVPEINFETTGLFKTFMFGIK